MKKMLLLFSHQLTESQKDDAKKNWGISQFVPLPSELQSIWSNINPDLECIDDLLKPLKAFLKKEKTSADVILIQGDFGACYVMTNYAKEQGLVPLYATTKRVVVEYIENTKVVKKSTFEHRRFRRYE